MIGRKSFCSCIFVTLVTLVFVFGCADVAPPPGGEIDRYPPKITGSIPENGAVNVPPGREVQVFFSERVLPPQSPNAVFFSPRPARLPEMKWKSNKLIIIFNEEFRTNQTYLISLTSEVTDLRRNRLDTGATIAFSTGPTIDSGRVSGRIFLGKQAASAVLVGLYDDTTSSFGDSAYPIYLSQSNQNGYFVFEYLPIRPYRMVAFKDVNRNQVFNVGKESFAVPDQNIAFGEGSSVDKLLLWLTSQDTTVPEIVSATYTADRIIRLRFARKYEMKYPLSHPATLTIIAENDTSVVMFDQGARPQSESNVNTLNFSAGQLAPGNYRLQLAYDTLLPPVEHEFLKCTDGPDQTEPRIVAFAPKDSISFAGQVELSITFSEPIDSAQFTPETFVLWEGETKFVPLTLQWTGPFTLSLVVADFSSASHYRLDITEFEISDLSGNRLGDSLKSYFFATYNSDSLGSVSGQVSLKQAIGPASPVVLEWTNLDDQRRFIQELDGELFEMALPPGRYRLSGYYDRNGNGRQDRGSVMPYLLAEKAAIYSDTVAVRARFETSEIEFVFE